MKVLLIKPMEHPQVVDIENSLKEFYRILDCDCITATYPWEERAALVTDDNGLFTEKSFSRYIPELEQPIKGNFFICGLGEEDFAELPQDLIQKFREQKHDLHKNQPLPCERNPRGTQQPLVRKRQRGGRDQGCR